MTRTTTRKQWRNTMRKITVVACLLAAGTFFMMSQTEPAKADEFFGYGCIGPFCFGNTPPPDWYGPNYGTPRPCHYHGNYHHCHYHHGYHYHGYYNH